MIKNYFVKTFFFALIICALTSCSEKRMTPVEEGNLKGILHIGNGDEPSGIDPHLTTGMPEARLGLALFEGLVSKNPKTLEVIPGVAKDWTISEDGKVYTFNMRTDAKWSNGDPVTAEDFVWSWRRALSPKLGNQYAYSLFIVENAEAFYRGDLPFEEVGVKALAKHTLQVKLAYPTSYFLQVLDHHVTYPVHRATVLKFGKIDERDTLWTRPGNFVGNGPFSLKTWVPNKIFVVEKNLNYWGKKDIKLNEIHFHPVQQPMTEERMFRAGQLHIIRQLPSSKIASYKKDNPDVLRTFDNFATYFYRLNTKVKPLDDVRVRKALASSINRKLITKAVSKGGQQPAFNLTPPDPHGYVPKAEMKYDPDQARQWLAEAGFPGGEGFPKLTLLFNTMDAHKRIAEAIQQMWKQELNIDITLENQDWKVFLANMSSLNYQIARASWVGDYLDPNTFLELMITDGGNNETGWSNKRFDELISLAAKTHDQKARFAYFQEAEAILVEEAPLIPIYTYAMNQLVQPSVKEWHNNVMDYFSYKHVHLVADTNNQ